jgi:hypothetical protein
MKQLMNRRYVLALLVIGVVLVLGSSTLNLGGGFITLGFLLALFAAGALLWEAFRPRRGV